ncbi:nucleotide exchange factor GrpE [Candidatus Peregrinibacteria bacterium CG1_02_54_53]|nr:MAG: nucleotide exchange factor GrpE [Candidatus Peregrinibacteria bacterium CG1_02_54_53]
MAAAKKSQPAQQGSPEIAKLQAECVALKQEADRLKDIAGRAQADLQNAKERLERERQDVGKFALAGALTRLLPTIDNFQRAFQHLPQELSVNDWVKGVAAIEQELVKQVTDLGLQKINALGQPLDPAKHEVLQTGPGEQDTVIEVFEEGYEFNGRILRPAKVKVGDGQ